MSSCDRSPEGQTPCYLVLTTCADSAAAERLARTLVRAGKVACVNLVPGVRSIYRWQGAIESADEVLLLAKTAADPATVTAAIRAAHDYEVPEVVCVAIDSGLPAYLDWVAAHSRLHTGDGRSVDT